MIIEGIDGITHINIYSQGKTELGRWLSNFTYFPIEIEGITFNSIETYWYWLITKDDRLLETCGYNSKKLGKQIMKDEEIVHPLSKDSFYFDKDAEVKFKKQIKKALDIKLKSNKDKLREFTYSTLLFAHYYIYFKKKVNAGHGWIIDHFEERRKRLKEFNNVRSTEIS